MFFIKKFFDDDQKLYVRFFVTNGNFITKHVKTVKISRFFDQNSRLFQNFSNSRFPGKKRQSCFELTSVFEKYQNIE